MPLPCRLLAAVGGSLLPFGECCSSVAVCGWVCTIGTFLKVVASRECFAPVTFLYTPHLYIHHVEVLCFQLSPLFF